MSFKIKLTAEDFNILVAGGRVTTRTIVIDDEFTGVGQIHTGEIHLANISFSRMVELIEKAAASPPSKNNPLKKP